MTAAAISARWATVLVLSSANASRTVNVPYAFFQAASVVSLGPAMCSRYLTSSVTATSCSRSSSSLSSAASLTSVWMSCCCSPLGPRAIADDFATLSFSPEPLKTCQPLGWRPFVL
ncbi:hypothetical protein PR002_g20806 [Phytophthora rubi]|uniref:Secreted protein n=1 Tax=Phytophthora rubi TaxID=129364 RepID=A0A6A3JIX4_9STRA|nr:hypothetical protein PR002_g20806 [Phytophthora rubi]